MASVFSFRALHFVRADPRLLAYGLLLTFSSAFGQTFFISLFSGEIRAAFAISNGEFGAIYSAGTLASAALLSWSGHWIDRIDLRRWTVMVIILSTVACVAMALAQDLWMETSSDLVSEPGQILPQIESVDQLGDGRLPKPDLLGCGRCE